VQTANVQCKKHSSQNSAYQRFGLCTVDWGIALNAKRPGDIIYWDYATAFDFLVHSKLLYELPCFGVCHMVEQSGGGSKSQIPEETSSWQDNS